MKKTKTTCQIGSKLTKKRQNNVPDLVLMFLLWSSLRILVTFTGEILNGKLHILRSVSNSQEKFLTWRRTTASVVKQLSSDITRLLLDIVRYQVLIFRPETSFKLTIRTKIPVRIQYQMEFVNLTWHLRLH